MQVEYAVVWIKSLFFLENHVIKFQKKLLSFYGVWSVDQKMLIRA